MAAFSGPIWHQSRDGAVLLASRRYNGSRSRKTKGSLADTLQCNIWRRAQTAAAALRQLELDGPVRWSAVGIRHGPAGGGGRGPVGPFLVTDRLRLPSESLEDCRPASASASQLAEPPARAVPGPGRAVRVARSTKGDRMFYRTSTELE